MASVFHPATQMEPYLGSLLTTSKRRIVELWNLDFHSDVLPVDLLAHVHMCWIESKEA